MSRKIRLSKSKIADGLVCHKKAYLGIHSSDLADPITPALQARFNSGTDVGIKAREEFPGGHLIDKEYWEIEEAIAQTNKLIAQGVNTIYEASFGNADYHCRVDILHRSSQSDPWEVYEVKSGLDPKPEYVLDLSIQCWILRECGNDWKTASIIHLNRECIYPDLSNLFVKADVTEAVEDNLSDFSETANELKSLVSLPEPPKIDIGRHCESPYECGFKNYCWSHVPQNSIFRLPLPWRLFDKGKLALKDVAESDLSNSQKLPFKVLQSSKVHIDKNGLKKATTTWKFPIYHLDFETIGPAIPRYDGTRPYTAIPFQFSLHIQLAPSEEPKHFEYLHEDASDPRRPLAEKLVEWIPKDKHPVMAYNSGFEKGVLETLAKMYPDLSAHLLSIAERLVDPGPVIKTNVYHPDFDGSFGLKSVAPALLGEDWDYSKLEVSDGKLAQVTFDQMVALESGNPLRKDLEAKLLAYCAQDTLAMVELVNWIHKNSK